MNEVLGKVVEIATSEAGKKIAKRTANAAAFCVAMKVIFGKKKETAATEESKPEATDYEGKPITRYSSMHDEKSEDEKTIGYRTK